jgi:DMSO/TMAO reductase YedYZ molybdopterin-dependent catalytic subunit
MNTEKTPRLEAFALGVIAVCIGIFVGELTSNRSSAWKSPIDSLGSWIISVIPRFLESFAIKLFGTHDKSVLVSIILVVALLLGGLAGEYLRQKKSGIAYSIVALETLFGALTVIARPHSGVFAVVPALMSGISTALVLYFALGRVKIETTQKNSSTQLSSRRQVLMFAGGAGVLGALMLISGQKVKTHGLNAIKRLAIKLPAATQPLPPPPVDPALQITGLSPLITSNDQFYRIDTAINVPIIDAETWSLSINGMVKNSITLNYADLLNRPMFELDDTMSCVSNPVGGPLIGNARWLGCRLDDLIKEAEPLSNADQILSSSGDGFGAGFPLNLLDGRDAMIAIGMNGQLLPIEHGFPARVIVPGLYGYVSATKWLTNIELTRFDVKQGFWISRGWSGFGPIKMESRIDYPNNGAAIPTGKFTFAGVAWAPLSGIDSVQVSIDGTWKDATLGPALSGTTWRQWWLDWDATSGKHEIQVRAVGVSGEVQTQDVADVAPNGASGWHTIKISA